MGEKTQLVWLKRDLRLHDHAPLVRAARTGPVVVLYVYEPDQLQAPTHDPSHLEFVNESLKELENGLAERGARLTVVSGTVPDVFDRLRREIGFEAIWSHEETGHARSYARDRRVKAWCRDQGVRWFEIPQTGVVRPLRRREGWAAQWRQRMAQAIEPPPARLVDALDRPLSWATGVLGPTELGLPHTRKSAAQPGGETLARDTLDGFLAGRSVSYQKDMSSPLAGADACSRLSAHLAYGNISLREVFQRSTMRRDELKELRSSGEEIPATWLPSLASFEKRLRWHCHFMQKLEDEPEIEVRNMARTCDGLREEDWREDFFEAWAAGQTGYPMVDACMRSLHATGWVNFRMRAMLVSFASYHLWLHWPRVAEHLARMFVDFEPGIHYSQVQMQSGTTGINAVRIYSPTKQVLDQDPEGTFLKRWIPELESVPREFIAEPYRMPPLEAASAGFRIGRDYPAPIVDHLTAVRAARQRIAALRKTEPARRERESVYRKHGSRMRPRPRRRTPAS